MLAVAACPIPASSNGLWIDSGAPNTLKFRKTDGSDTSLGAGGGGGTLATSYAAGSSNTDETLALNSTNGGLVIADNATPIGSNLLTVRSNGGTQFLAVTASQMASTYLAIGTAQSAGYLMSNTTAATAGNQQYSPGLGFVAKGWNPTSVSSVTVDALWQLRPVQQGSGDPVADMVLWIQTGAGSLTESLAVDQLSRLKTPTGTTLTLFSGKGDGASSVAIVQDTAVAYSTAGAKLFSFRNNGTEEIYVDKTGVIGAAVGNALSGTLSLLTEHADGASAVGIIMDTSTAWSTVGGKPVSFRTGGVEKGCFGDIGTGFSFGVVAGGGYWDLSGAAGMRCTSTSQLDWYTSSALRMEMSTAALYPTTTFGLTLGKAGNFWGSVSARQYIGVEQTIAAAATITLDPASGESIRITLGATGITTINAGTGSAGQEMMVQVIQDATGGRTISGWSSSFQLAGGAYTVTATASKRDVLCFVWDTVATHWIEKSRSMNC
jgi:hypothetical protein